MTTQRTGLHWALCLAAALTIAAVLASVAGFGAVARTVKTAAHSAPAFSVHWAPTLSVRGNHLVGPKGHTVRLTGVNRSGAEYACAEGWGIWDGPTNSNTAILAMAAWRINAVRIPLNEDCWLGINGVKRAYSGTAYRSAIANYVTRLERFGMTPVLNLHFSAPGRHIPDDQTPMADEAHSPAFWHSLAGYFSKDHRVLFDLFNEPYPDSNKDTKAAWSCVLAGGTCPGVPYRTAGMQQLVNIVRAAGATQPLLIGGPQYAGDLDRWLQYAPHDPLRQLVASIHIYEPNWAPCDTLACWDSQIARVAAKVPVVEGEIGSKNCTARSITPLLDWSDAHGVSYLAWAWNVGSCRGEPSLITSYQGAATQWYGQRYHNHLVSVHHG